MLGKKLLTGCLCLLFACSFLLSGCDNPMFNFGGYEYPDFPYADEDPSIDSWT